MRYGYVRGYGRAIPVEVALLRELSVKDTDGSSVKISWQSIEK